MALYTIQNFVFDLQAANIIFDFLEKHFDSKCLYLTSNNLSEYLDGNKRLNRHEINESLTTKIFDSFESDWWFLSEFNNIKTTRGDRYYSNLIFGSSIGKQIGVNPFGIDDKFDPNKKYPSHFAIEMINGIYSQQRSCKIIKILEN